MIEIAIREHTSIQEMQIRTFQLWQNFVEKSNRLIIWRNDEYLLRIFVFFNWFFVIFLDCWFVLILDRTFFFYLTFFLIWHSFWSIEYMFLFLINKHVFSKSYYCCQIIVTDLLEIHRCNKFIKEYSHMLYWCDFQYAFSNRIIFVFLIYFFALYQYLDFICFALDLRRFNLVRTWCDDYLLIVKIAIAVVSSLIVNFDFLFSRWVKYWWWIECSFFESWQWFDRRFLNFNTKVEFDRDAKTFRTTTFDLWCVCDIERVLTYVLFVKYVFYKVRIETFWLSFVELQMNSMNSECDEISLKALLFFVKSIVIFLLIIACIEFNEFWMTRN